MKGLLKLLAGVFIIILIGTAALTMDDLPGSAASAERQLAERAGAALGVEAAETIAVDMNGQKAVLTGSAPSDEARKAVIDRVALSQGAGGLLLGGVTAVDASGLVVTAEAAKAAPFTLTVRREEGRIVLTGYAPDQAARDRLYRLVGELFPDITMTGDIEIAAGVPVNEADWLNAFTASLRALSYLTEGELSANDATLSLRGEADSDVNADAARMLLAGLPDGFSGEAAVTVPTPPEPIAEPLAIAEDTRDDNQAAAPADNIDTTRPAAAPAPDPCLSSLQALIDLRRIGFTSARADIDAPTRNHLRRIAAVLDACPAARLNITGHTDASGNAARNRQLSGYRADAVRAFLISVGAPADRIRASGAGSSEPVASNATPAGRELNRRIEIEILTTE